MVTTVSQNWSEHPQTPIQYPNIKLWYQISVNPVLDHHGFMWACCFGQTGAGLAVDLTGFSASTRRAQHILRAGVGRNLTTGITSWVSKFQKAWRIISLMKPWLTWLIGSVLILNLHLVTSSHFLQCARASKSASWDDPSVVSNLKPYWYIDK